MSNRIKKTEHAGPKNGGGYWGKRHEAKMLSKKLRRAQSRQMEKSEASEYRGSEQADEQNNER